MKLKVFSFLVLVACGAQAALLTGAKGAPLVNADGTAVAEQGVFMHQLPGWGGWTKKAALDLFRMSPADRLQYLRDHRELGGVNLGGVNGGLRLAPASGRSPERGSGRSPERGQDDRSLDRALADYQRRVHDAQINGDPLPSPANRRERLAWLRAQHERDAVAAKVAREQGSIEPMYDHRPAGDRMDAAELRRETRERIYRDRANRERALRERADGEAEARDRRDSE